jgi:AcrR family transcriptional regulator
MQAKVEPLGASEEPTGALAVGAERHVHRLESGRGFGLRGSVVRIVDAAWRELEREGAHDIKIEQVLRQSGVSRRVFYHHFDSKQDLLALLLEHKQDKVAYDMIQALRGAESPLERVEAWVRGILSGILDPGELAFQRLIREHGVELVSSPSRDTRFGALLREPLLDALVEGRAHGQFGIDHPERTAQAIWLMCSGFLSGFRYADATDEEREVVIDAARVLCRPRGSSGAAPVR